MKKSILLVITGAAIFIAALLFVAFSATKTPKTERLDIATTLKLNIYNGMDSENVNGLIENGDIEKISQWAMLEVEKILEGNDIFLNETEREEVRLAICNNLEQLKSIQIIGNPNHNEDGISKAYISNAIAEALAYRKPELDITSTVDTSFSMYEKLSDLDQELAMLKENHSLLKETLATVNQMLSKEQKTQDITTAKELEESLNQMEAHYIELLSKIYVYVGENSKPVIQGETIKKPSADKETVEQVNKEVTSLTKMQQEMLEQLEEAIGQVDGLKDVLNLVQSNGKDTGENLGSVRENVELLQQQIASTQAMLSTVESTMNTKLDQSLTKQKETLSLADELNRSELEKMDARNREELEQADQLNRSELENADAQLKAQTNMELNALGERLTSFEASVDAEQQIQDGALNNLDTELHLMEEELNRRIDEVFQSASEGKELIQTTLTGLGMTPLENPTYQNISEQIAQLASSKYQQGMDKSLGAAFRLVKLTTFEAGKVYPMKLQISSFGSVYDRYYYVGFNMPSTDAADGTRWLIIDRMTGNRLGTYRYAETYNYSTPATPNYVIHGSIVDDTTGTVLGSGTITLTGYNTGSVYSQGYLNYGTANYYIGGDSCVFGHTADCVYTRFNGHTFSFHCTKTTSYASYQLTF